MPRSFANQYSCSVELTLDVVGGKWSSPISCASYSGMAS
jgi:DNA-binding HxlR family transcriptional regulator